MLTSLFDAQVGLLPADVYDLDQPEDAMKNAKRFERLWESEKKRCITINSTRDQKEELIEPSLSRVAWQFGKTRFLIALILVVLSMVFQFTGPVRFLINFFYTIHHSQSILMKYMLDYLKDPAAPLETGVLLLVLLFFSQLFRNITFNLQQSIGIQTGNLLSLRLMNLKFL